MKPRTEELLYFMMWSADHLLRPTFRNLTDSFETWAYRQGWQRQTAALAAKHLLERDTSASDPRIYRLSKQGRLHVLGGRDPDVKWSRSWDGLWRIILFDVPTSENSRRDRLRHYLRTRGFGLLQNSAWITPDRISEERDFTKLIRRCVENW